jgi:hypothetical protein
MYIIKGVPTYKINSIVCSWACAARYNHTYNNKCPADGHNADSILKCAHISFTGYDIDSISMAPPFTDLVRFGGSLSDDEFRVQINSMNQKTKSVDPIKYDMSLWK